MIWFHSDSTDEGRSMNRKKSNWLLSAVLVFCIVLLAVFAGAGTELKGRIILMYDKGCQSLLKDMISDAARYHELERQLLIQLRDRIEPSSGEYAFLARDNVLVFVRDDNTTKMFVNHETEDLIAMTSGLPAYRINMEKVYSGGVEYTIGIYTRESYILNKYGYDVLERRMFLSLLCLILTALTTILFMQRKLRKTQTERDRYIDWNRKFLGGVMSCERVKKYFNEHNIPNEIIILEESSATVELAAKALGREPGEIAKSLALKLKDGRVIILVVCGTARIDNRRFKDTFQCKAQMLSFDETLAATGHPVGGVCPFALPEGVTVYLDESLKRYDEVYPAAGTGNSAVRFTIPELEQATKGSWVHVTQDNT